MPRQPKPNDAGRPFPVLVSLARAGAILVLCASAALGSPVGARACIFSAFAFGFGAAWVLMAISRRERLWPDRLGRWDEAAVLLAAGFVASLFVDTDALRGAFGLPPLDTVLDELG